MYRKVRKRKIREFHSTLITQLDTLLEKNPKDYWSLLEKLSTSNNGNNNNKSLRLESSIKQLIVPLFAF